MQTLEILLAATLAVASLAMAVGAGRAVRHLVSHATLDGAR